MKNIIKVSLYTHTLKQCEFPTLKLVYCALTSKFDIRNALQWPRFMCTETVISCITFILKGKIYLDVLCMFWVTWGFQELFLACLSSGLDDPTPLLWICFIVVADVIANDKSDWLLNPLPGTVVSISVDYSIIYEADVILVSFSFESRNVITQNI